MKKPDCFEEKWVDFDTDTDCWGIFGLVSGFCYQLFASEEEANEKLEKENNSC